MLNITVIAGWQGDFTKIPKDDVDGNLITYTVKKEAFYDRRWK